MKKSFLTVVLLSLRLPLLAFGWGDWQHTTPGSNLMSDGGSGTTFYFEEGSDEVNITRWYFYKNHVVAEGWGEFLIIDEGSHELMRFTDKQKWEAAIDQQALSPHIWTRWFSGNWKFYDDLIIFFLVFVVPAFFIFLLFVGLLFLALRSGKNESKGNEKVINGGKFVRTKQPHHWGRYTVVGFSLLLILRAVLDAYPSSI